MTRCKVMNDCGSIFVHYLNYKVVLLSRQAIGIDSFRIEPHTEAKADGLQHNGHLGSLVQVPLQQNSPQPAPLTPLSSS